MLAALIRRRSWVQIPLPLLEMELRLSISRPKPLFWVECLMAEAVLTGKPVTIVASSHEQATRAYQAATSFVKGLNRDPKVPSG